MSPLPMILLLLTAPVMAAESATPEIIKDQLETIRPALERATADYRKKVNAENDKLCKTIEQAMNKEAKAGRLDQAIALKEALERARNGEFIEAYLRPSVRELLGEGEGRTARKFLAADIAKWTMPGLKVLQPYRLQDGNLRFSDGGGIECLIPAKGTVTVVVTSGSLQNWNPFDAGRILIGDTEVYAQSWSVRKAFDNKPIASMTVTVNAKERTYSILINDKPFADTVAFKAGRMSTLKLIDKASVEYGSNIAAIEVQYAE